MFRIKKGDADVGLQGKSRVEETAKAEQAAGAGSWAGGDSCRPYGTVGVAEAQSGREDESGSFQIVKFDERKKESKNQPKPLGLHTP